MKSPLPETDSTSYPQVFEESFYPTYPEEAEDEYLPFNDYSGQVEYDDGVISAGAELDTNEMAIEGEWGGYLDEGEVLYEGADFAYYPSTDFPNRQPLHPIVLTPLAMLAFTAVLVLISLSALKIGPAISEGLTAGDTTIQNKEGNGQGEKQFQSTAGLAPLFTPSVQYWGSKIVEWSQKWNLDPNLVATVMQIESCGDPNAISSAGAMGLFQVMPFHFSAGEDGFDPQTNAQRGLAYLQQSLQAHNGDQGMALAGYNGGISGSQRPSSMWNNETQRYFYWGTGIYEDAASGKAQSSRLQEWLARGGAGLCERASQKLGIAQ